MLTPEIAFPEVPEFVIVTELLTHIVFADKLKFAVGAELTTIGETLLDVVPQALEATMVA